MFQVEPAEGGGGVNTRIMGFGNIRRVKHRPCRLNNDTVRRHHANKKCNDKMGLCAGRVEERRETDYSEL